MPSQGETGSLSFKEMGRSWASMVGRIQGWKNPHYFFRAGSDMALQKLTGRKIPPDAARQRSISHEQPSNYFVSAAAFGHEELIC